MRNGQGEVLQFSLEYVGVDWLKIIFGVRLKFV